jgi:hypothetical protein
MSFILKVVAQGETQRVPLDSTSPDYATVQAAVAKAFPFWHEYTLKYKDDEGDLCTLVDSTFDDFFVTAGAAAANTNIGPLVLKVELFPSQASADKPISLSPDQVAQRRNARRKQPTARSEWAYDPRDLEELVQNLADPDMKKKARKKRSKPAQKNGHALAASTSEIDAEFADQSQNGEDDHAFNPQFDDTGQALTPIMNETTDQVIDVVQKDDHTTSVQLHQHRDYHIGPPPCAHVVDARIAETSDHDQEYETDDGVMWDSHDDSTDCMKHDIADEALPKETLRRSASCPCAPTWLAEQDADGIAPGHHKPTSLVAQAWPFVEESVLADNSTQPLWHAPNSDQQGRLIGWSNPIGEIMSESYPATCGQVLWMPVLLPWPVNDSRLMPHMGMGMPVAACH